MIIFTGPLLSGGSLLSGGGGRGVALLSVRKSKINVTFGEPLFSEEGGGRRYYRNSTVSMD